MRRNRLPDLDLLEGLPFLEALLNRAHKKLRGAQKPLRHMFCTGTLERGVECRDVECRSHLYMPTANVIDVGDADSCAVCGKPGDAVLQCNRCLRVVDEGYGRTKRHANERCGAKLEYDEAQVIASDSEGEEAEPRVWGKRGGGHRVVVVDDDSSLELFD